MPAAARLALTLSLHAAAMLIGMPGTTCSTRGSARAALMRHAGRFVSYNGVRSTVLVAAGSTTALLQQATHQHIDELTRCCSPDSATKAAFIALQREVYSGISIALDGAIDGHVAAAGTCLATD